MTTMTWPEADVSEENVARLVAGLPEALLSAMAEAADQARAVAFHADEMIRRYHDLQTAIKVLAGASAFGNGADLTVAIVERTDLAVVWEVMAGIVAMVNEERDEAAQRLREHVRSYEGAAGYGPKRI